MFGRKPGLPNVTVEKPKRRRKPAPKPKEKVIGDQWATRLPRPKQSADGDTERPEVVNVLKWHVGGKDLQYYGDLVMEDLEAEF